MLKFTEDHEWLSQEDDTVIIVGITEYATEQLGDIVFVELPEVGKEVAKGDEIVVIESVKAASDILAPLDGEITEVNEAVSLEPGLVNAEPMDSGWFFKMKIKPAQIDVLNGYMSEDDYKKHIEG